MRALSPAVPLFVVAGLGALLGLLLDGGRPLTLLLVVSLSGIVAAASLAARGLVARAGLVVALSFSVGVASGAARVFFSEERAAALPRDPAVFVGVVRDIWESASGARRLIVDVDGVLTVGGGRPLLARLQVLVPAAVNANAAPGDRVRIRGRARPLLPAFSPGELDARGLGIARGVDGRITVVASSDLAVVERRAVPAVFARLRLMLRERMVLLLPPRLAGLELALLVGDTSLLDEEQRDIYRRVGAGHLLAVSGLQVSLIALLLRRGFLALLLATSWGRRGGGLRLASWLALGGVLSFVFLCGAPPSAVRAAAMATAMLAADLLGRRARALDALAIAGLGTVLLSPGSVLDPSFLLSYAAVLGLVASSSSRSSASPDGEGSPLQRTLGAAIVASVGAGLVTLPVSAHLFGEVAPAGLVANVVLVPAATLLQIPSLVCGLLGVLLHAPVIAWFGAQAALVLEALAAGLGEILPGVRPVSAPGGMVTLLLFGCAIVFAASLARRKPAAGVVAVLGAGAVCVVAAREPAGVRISVLPVGQGDAAVVEFPDGQVMLIDGGGTWDGKADPGEDVVLPFLRRRGIEAIDVMVLSHPHPDHALGLSSVAAAVPVRELWHNGSSPDGPLLGRVLAALPLARVRTTPELLGAHRFGSATVDVLAPAPAERTSLYPELGANDNSLVLKLCVGRDCALWPGDVESLGEDLLIRSGADLRAAVVKAPHHGSRTSSTDELVRRTEARHVVFCTGPENTFHFPHLEVLARWRRAGARPWDTAVHGELTIELTGSGVAVTPFVDGEVSSPEDG